MRVNKIKIRIITLGVILFFILSTIGNIFVVNVSAGGVKLVEDGIWYDEFNDTDSVFLDSNCNWTSSNDGYIHLGQGEPVHEYDYLKTPEDIQVWELNKSGWGGLRPISLMVTPLIPGDLIDPKTEASRLGKLKYRDGTSITTESSKHKAVVPDPEDENLTFIPNYPIHHFRFKIDQEQDMIQNFTISWFYGLYNEYANIENINMYLWRYGDPLPRWENVGVRYYNEPSISDNVVDIQCSSNDDVYFSEDGYIDVILVATPIKVDFYGYSILNTDFISITVRTIYGVLSEGTIRSDVIEIDEEDFGGWENVFWEESIGNDYYITVQVLYENNTLIEGFTSTSSPLNINDIGIEINKIKLQATLHSDSPTHSPKIFNWGVMWQKLNQYKDTFTYDFRIGEKNGVDIENGEIKVSKFFSNWEIFGKNSANTRAYDGKKIETAPTGYYWVSGANIGGGFRSPVVSDGRVYIASYDKRIYAYNETQDLTFTNGSAVQKYVDRSNVLDYEVDACIAIAGDYLIVGTSEPGKENKLIALNKYDLSDEKWRYPDASKTICFTSPPVVDDGKIFISSWGGTIYDTPFLSMLGSFLGMNNLLIALDINGAELWEPKKLPSGSISTPVIGNNYVYVGCQNMFGSSLLAYDLDSGDGLWNQTVGVIGRSSPVYADNTIFVCANVKNSTTNSRENKIFAVDANNGDVLWNRTIGQINLITRNQLLKGRSFLNVLLEGFAPITTPTYYDKTLYVFSPDGTLLALENNGSLKWSARVSSLDIFADLISLFSFYTASPLVIDGMIYVVTGSGTVFAYDSGNFGNNVQPKFKFDLTIPKTTINLPVMASPVLADGLLFISCNYDEGYLLCVGSYSPNKNGDVSSTTIHVPIKRWWQSFKVNKTDTTSNTIKLSILDENGNTLKTFSGYNNTSNNISDLTTNSIKLYASFEITNLLDTQPSLNSWELTWVKEEEPPVFIYSDEDQVLYANQELQEISIGVKDIADNNVISGLDLTTAQFRIGYIPKNSNTPKLSSWLPAESDEIPGSRVIQTVITANLADLDFEVSSFNNITFRIKDLAGNLATSNTSYFEIDNEKPKSYILDKENFTTIYNEKVTISANASDNISGLKEVSLIYWYKELEGDDWGSLQYYDKNQTQNFKWVFGELNGKTIKSGWYRISTMAKDKAGNIEDIDILTNSITILFDNINPIFNTQFDDNYLKTELPRFELEISDDYLLGSLEYRLESETIWYTIDDGIDDKSFKVDWSLAENKWASWNEGTSQYIFFRVKDFCGNEYNTTEQNSPLIDKVNMEDFNIDLSDFNEWHWGDIFTITPSVPDYLNVEQVQIFYSFSKDKKNWTDYKQYDGNLTVYPYTWQFTAVEGNGYYKFYTKITTLEGDVYTTPEQIIIATILPAGLFAVLLILTTILILVTAIVLYKIKQKKKYQ
ncbi:MAG: hypothetical protein BV457_01360 [Thermoplasmata archaeon M9B1D]|nr:MAG: hypothetical protein BV457_01360 [Thermoplasmata archaeon M9B1D]